MGVLKRLYKGIIAVSLAAVFSAGAAAQPPSGIDGILARTTTPPVAQPPNLTATEKTALQSALGAARSADRGRFNNAYQLIGDVDARRLAMWALIDVDGEAMTFAELDAARRDLAGWPRAERRGILTEQKIDRSGLSPQGVIDWFGSDEPRTAEGAMALASALQASGRTAEAQSLVRRFWREKIFEAAPQSQFLARFGSMLTSEDHIARADLLLYGPQGPAAQAIVNLLPPDYRALSEARMALRRDAGNRQALVDAVPQSLQSHGGLIFERVANARRNSQISTAFALAPSLPQAPGFDDGDQRIYSERRNLFILAMQARNDRAAFDAMANGGFKGGVRQAEADFFAGWVALTRLNDANTALQYFRGVREAGSTPITQGRALYWLGRAAEAQGDSAGAQAYYQEGAQHIGSFYGQLAAEKAGITTLVLPAEPQPTAADVARFESRPQVRAARILADIDDMRLFTVFVQDLDDNLPTAEEYALLIDMSRQYGERFTAMMNGRAAAGRGFLLPERMYPVLAAPNVPGAPEQAFVLAITRQESSFDPEIRSSADARGMMMLLPSTARGVARRLGVSFQESQLYEADYNMRLGTFHLGELMDQQSGSFLLTAVGYNAGPARPPQWTAYCGDPRSSFTDPLDFIECVPFTETRDYMMRVMENLQIYRARLNGGQGPLTPSRDLKRGGYGTIATN
jgi:soluble lytic murein transglycosylase